MIFTVLAGTLSILDYIQQKLQTITPRNEQIAQPNKPAQSSLKIQRLTGDGKTDQAVISPDGKFLAYVRNEDGRKSLWVKQIFTNSNVQVVAASVMERFYRPTFSPDGNYVYFGGINKDNPRGSIFRVPTLGGAASKIISEAAGLSFSPDGKQVVFHRIYPAKMEHTLITANADGTDERKLASWVGHQWINAPPVWSPDGKLVACAIGDDRLAERRHTIVLIEIDGGAIKELTNPKWGGVGSVRWLPDMSGLVFLADETGGGEGVYQLWEISYPAGEARRLTHNLLTYSGLSLTANGKTLITVENEMSSGIWVSPNADITRARQVATGKGYDARGITWTPDKRIVYVSTTSGVEEVWIMNQDGSNAQQLTNDGQVKYTPVVSPDGRYVIYTGTGKGKYLWRIDLGGGNPVQLTNGNDDSSPDISPDGKWVVYSAYTSGTLALWRVPIEGGEKKQLTTFTSHKPRISPDGENIACFFYDENLKKWQLAIIPFEGGLPVKTFDLPQTVSVHPSLTWTPDGRSITYIDMRGGVGNLWLQPVEGGAPTQLTDYKQDGIYRYEWTRDGKQVAIVRGENSSDAVMITNFR